MSKGTARKNPSRGSYGNEMDDDIDFSEVLATISKVLSLLVNQLSEQSKKHLFIQKEQDVLLQNLPRIVNVQLEEKNASGSTITCVKSEIKHIPIVKSTMGSVGSFPSIVHADYKYLPYVEIGIEHSKTLVEKTSWGTWLVRCFSIAAMVVVLAAGVFGMVKFIAERVTETKPVVPQSEGTNQMQKN